MFLLILVATVTLCACSSKSEKNADELASNAFEALIEYAHIVDLQTLNIEEVSWLCATTSMPVAPLKSETIESTSCRYYIVYQYHDVLTKYYARVTVTLNHYHLDINHSVSGFDTYELLLEEKENNIAFFNNYDNDNRMLPKLEYRGQGSLSRQKISELINQIDTTKR